MSRCLCTSDSVTEGHPDKIADRIGLTVPAFTREKRDRVDVLRKAARA